MSDSNKRVYSKSKINEFNKRERKKAREKIISDRRIAKQLAEPTRRTRTKEAFIVKYGQEAYDKAIEWRERQNK